MIIGKKLILSAAVAAVSLSLAAGRASAQQDPGLDDLKAQLKALQDRVNQLEESNRTRPTDAEIARTRDAVTTDVARKANNVGVTYNNGLTFSTSDPELFSLKANLHTQFRYIASLGNSDNRDDEAGFEFRRVRPGVSGNVFSKDLTYSLVLDMDRDTGNVSLYDLYFTYRFPPDWAVKFGQFKQSLDHENDIADAKQLGVERSVLETVIGGSGRIDRVQGIAVTYGGTKNTDFRAEFAVTDGARSGLGGSGRDFRNGNGPGGDTYRNFGLGARGEWKAMGEWADYSDFSSKKTKKNLVVFGVGADRTEAGDREYYTGVADVLAKTPDAWSFYGAGIANYNENAVGTTIGSNAAGGGAGANLAPSSENDALTYGAVGQIGYLVNPSVEVFTRGGVTFFDNPNLFPAAVRTNDDYFPELTVGADYYLGRNGERFHNAKISLDFTYLPNGYPVNATGSGVLASEDAEYVVRLQFQLIL